MRVQVNELTEQQKELTSELRAAVEERNELSAKLGNMCLEKDAMQSELHSTASVCRL
jgi:uncharacterized coiled-coil DUF342 family protein